MNPPVTFPPFPPALKLPKRPSECGTALGYIAPESSATPVPDKPGSPVYIRPGSVPPMASDSTLEAAWDQLHRARALLEAEQKNLRDERMMLRALEADLKRREETVRQREHAVAERETLVAAAEGTASCAQSTLARLTRAAFGGKG